MSHVLVVVRGMCRALEHGLLFSLFGAAFIFSSSACLLYLDIQSIPCTLFEVCSILLINHFLLFPKKLYILWRLQVCDFIYFYLQNTFNFISYY
jgi:hypothetical protein